MRIVEKIDRRYAIAIVEDVGRGNGRSHEFRDHRGHVPFTTCRFPVRRRSWLPMGVVEAQVLKTARALFQPVVYRFPDFSSRNGTSLSGRMSPGIPRTRSAMMLRRISSLPPAIRKPGA